MRKVITDTANQSHVFETPGPFGKPVQLGRGCVTGAQVGVSDRGEYNTGITTRVARSWSDGGSRKETTPFWEADARTNVCSTFAISTPLSTAKIMPRRVSASCRDPDKPIFVMQTIQDGLGNNSAILGSAT
jgi:hypothetical protein